MWWAGLCIRNWIGLMRWVELAQLVLYAVSVVPVVIAVATSVDAVCPPRVMMRIGRRTSTILLMLRTARNLILAGSIVSRVIAVVTSPDAECTPPDMILVGRVTSAICHMRLTA